MGRAAARRPPGRARHLRRAHASRHRHRRDGRATTRSSIGSMDRLRHLARLHVLPRRARPAPGLPRRRTTGRSSSRPARSGRLIPFVRLDLDEGPIEEARRCLDLGARGIKLHPRAQRFLLDDERLAPVFELAAERGVPILIHGGRGLPPIAEGLERARRRAPRRAADHRPRRDRRPRRPRRPLRGQARRLLRHLGLERDRPARPLRGSCRRSRSSTPRTTRTASSPARCSHRAARRARGRASTSGSCGTCSRGNANRIADGEEPLEPTQPSAPAIARAAARARADPPVPLDGDAASLDAASPTRSARSGSRSTHCASANGHVETSSSGSASCSRPPATSGGRCPRREDDGDAAQRVRARPSG